MVASLQTESKAGSRTSPALMIDTPHSCGGQGRERKERFQRKKERKRERGGSKSYFVELLKCLLTFPVNRFPLYSSP